MGVAVTDSQRRARSIFVILGVVAVMGLVAIIAIIYMENRKSGQVIIENFSDCVKDISDDDRLRVFRGIYGRVGVVKRAKSEKTDKYYTGKIRANTCKTTDHTKEGQGYTDVEFIIDIPKPKYSFSILFSYISEKTPYVIEGFDVGDVYIYCVEDKDRIYDDFGCVDLGVSDEKFEPLFEISSYVDEGCYIQPTTSGTSKSGYSIIIVYDPPSSVYEDGTYVEFKQSCKEKAMKHLEDNNINLDDYLIFEKTQIVK